MKHFLLVILSLSFGINTIGQDVPDSGFTNKVEAENVMVNDNKQGKWVEYFRLYPHDDHITADTNADYYKLTIYKDGNPEGISRDYQKPAILLKEIPYKNGLLDGMVKLFDNGMPIAEIPFKNDSANGVAKYYTSGGVLLHEIPYLKNKVNGTERWYNEKSGKLESEIDWVNGREIELREFDKKGKLKKTKKA